MPQDKRKNQGPGQKPQNRKITKKAKAAIEGSFTEVLLHDVKRLLAEHSKPVGDGLEKPEEHSSKSTYPPPERFTEIDVKISDISSTGDGIGLSGNSDHVYVVPFTVPGDVVRAKVVNHFPQDNYTLADFIKVIEPSTQRDDSRAKCPYFTKCSGCQFQMLSYDDQLAHKKTIVERAYRNFSNLAPGLVPAIGETMGSPLQYGYRTKLTPHFDGPPGRSSMRKGKEGNGPGFTEVPPIGFMMKGRKTTMDIEDCPIGTDAVRQGMKRERARVAKEIASYKRGATVLLRESTKRTPKEMPKAPQPNISETAPIAASIDGNVNGIDETSNADLSSRDLLHSGPDILVTATTRDDFLDEKTCITDFNALATEYIDQYVFNNMAGAFFQNNNSILPSFNAYIRDHILPPPHPTAKPIRYLIDAYCGSGLFTITLSSLFSASIGIDIAPPSIKAAHENAKSNNIANATFMTADASALFAKVTYAPDETVVVIDPPRKGCDDNFLQQLLRFGPRRVVYVSCNVHTQARDVGVLVEGQGGARYDLESLRGFDFFPQTGHVEGVAVLNRVEDAKSVESGPMVEDVAAVVAS
ncbi:tRNA(m5U54)methyltransferase [Trapelia coarctata]|nr:tRNA(m5U54)methyltransferase [Trapelia coarctata]